MTLERSKPPRSRLRRAAGLGLLVLAAFSAGLVFAPPSHAGRFNPYQKLGVFTKVLSYIESHYVEDIAETDLMYGAARGLTDVLDPHSRFMDPDEYGRLKKETEGNEEIDGIGIDVEKRKNQLRDHLADRGLAGGARPASSRATSSSASTASRSSTLEFDDAIARMQGPRRQRGGAGGRPPRPRADLPHQARPLRGQGGRGTADRARRRLHQDPRLLHQHRLVARRSARSARRASPRAQGAGARPAPQPGRAARPGRSASPIASSPTASSSRPSARAGR